MKTDIILIGGGGHCKACIDVIEQVGTLRILGILDMPEKMHQKVQGYPIIGTDEDIPALVKKCPQFLVTVGQIMSPATRIRLFTGLQELGAASDPVASPTSYISDHALVGEGTVVLHRVLVNANARIGKNCIINTGAIIEHDVVIGDHCHISTGAIVNGGTTVGEGSFVGSGAVVHNNIRIGSNAIIGAGEVVSNDVSDNARRIRG